jgi:hypothetical protein
LFLTINHLTSKKKKIDAGEKKTHHAVYTANQTKKVHIICIDNTPVREAPSIDIDTKKKEENEATKKHTHTHTTERARDRLGSLLALETFVNRRDLSKKKY